MILAFDTSANPLVMALWDKGQNRLAAELWLDTPATHGQTLLPALDFFYQRLPGLKISALGVCLGPGSFTGLRVGLASAQGLAFSLGVPVAGLSSLELLALNQGPLPAGRTLWAIMDARQGMVYAAPFTWQGGQLTRLAADGAASPARLRQMLEAPASLAGTGALLYQKELAGEGIDILSPPLPLRGALLGQRAAWKLDQGMVLAPEEIKPNYCRPSDAEARFALPLEPYNLL